MDWRANIDCHANMPVNVKVAMFLIFITNFPFQRETTCTELKYSIQFVVTRIIFGLSPFVYIATLSLTKLKHHSLAKR